MMTAETFIRRNRNDVRQQAESDRYLQRYKKEKIAMC